MNAEAILGEVDFVSIGTNDLTQYTMAADRLLGDLAHLNNPLAACSAEDDQDDR